MRVLLIAAPLMLASCSLFEGKSNPPAQQPDAASLVASAVDDAQIVTDKRFSEMRATLEQMSADQARLRDQLTDLRNAAREDTAAVLAAEATAEKSQHLLLLTSIVAALASVASIILAIVCVWQAVVMRRMQREAGDVERRLDEAAERAAMAGGRAAAPGAAAGAPGTPATGPFARLRRRPPS